jgi:drug/metabolite transporter (DMT)-like permease
VSSLSVPLSPAENPADPHLWLYQSGLAVFAVMMAGRKIGAAHFSQEMNPLYLSFLISSLALLFGLGVRWFSDRARLTYAPRQVARPVAVLALGTLLGMVGENSALRYISPVLNSLLNLSLYSFCVSLIAWKFGSGELVRFRAILPIIAVAVGGIIIFSRDDLRGLSLADSLAGLAWTLLSIVGWAGAIVAAANLVRTGVPVADVIALRFAGPALVLGPYLFLRGELGGGLDLSPGLILLALLGYYIPFQFSFRSVKKVSVVTLAISTMTVPLLVYLLSMVFLDYPPMSRWQWLGAALTFGAVGYRLLAELRPAPRYERGLTAEVLIKSNTGD